MFQNFFYRLKSKKIPVSTTELLDLIRAVSFHSENQSPLTLKKFYSIARSCLIKDIKYYDEYEYWISMGFILHNLSLKNKD